MKKACIEDFKPVGYQSPITAGGQIIAGKHNANMSSILSKLIQEAGRWCKSYASDLFIWWSAIAGQVEAGSLESGAYQFGFDETGVDSAKSILHHYENMDYMAGLRYRAIWRLDVTISENNSDFKLYEVQR